MNGEALSAPCSQALCRGTLTRIRNPTKYSVNPHTVLIVRVHHRFGFRLTFVALALGAVRQPRAIRWFVFGKVHAGFCICV